MQVLQVHWRVWIAKTRILIKSHPAERENLQISSQKIHKLYVHFSLFVCCLLRIIAIFFFDYLWKKNPWQLLLQYFRFSGSVETQQMSAVSGTAARHASLVLNWLESQV